MATERLEAELVSHAAWEAVGIARMLDVLGEYDRRDGWSRWIGCLREVSDGLCKWSGSVP